MRYTIEFPMLPATLNEIIRICKDEPREYGRLKAKYTRLCAFAALGCPAFTGRIWLHFHWLIYTYDRDPADNLQAAAKPVLDGLVNLKILKQDNAHIIQQPVVITWQQSKREGLHLTISDRPLFKLIALED